MFVVQPKTLMMKMNGLIDTCPKKGNSITINNLQFTDNKYNSVTAVIWWDI